MNRKISIFLLIFILIFALFSVTSICFGAKNIDRLWGKPGLNASKVNTETINKVSLKTVTVNGIKVALKESTDMYANKLMIYFPGEGQFDSVADSFPFTANYNFDIAVVQAPKQKDPKNPNLLTFSSNDKFGAQNVQAVLTIFKNYLNNKYYTISICGYSAGGRGAIDLTKKIIENTDYLDMKGSQKEKNAMMKGRVELMILDGKQNETNANTIKDIIKSPIVKMLTIIASGDKTNRIASNTLSLLNDLKGFKSLKFKQLDCTTVKEYSKNNKYTTHANLMYFLYDDARRAFYFTSV